MINYSDIIKEIEYYESKQLYKLADKITEKLVKIAANISDFPKMKGIFNATEFRANMSYMNKVCPEIMGNSNNLQIFTDYKDSMIKKIKQGMTPQQAAEAQSKESVYLLNGNFQSCFENLAKSIMQNNQNLVPSAAQNQNI